VLDVQVGTRSVEQLDELLYKLICWESLTLPQRDDGKAAEASPKLVDPIQEIATKTFSGDVSGGPLLKGYLQESVVLRTLHLRTLHGRFLEQRRGALNRQPPDYFDPLAVLEFVVALGDFLRSCKNLAMAEMVLERFAPAESGEGTVELERLAGTVVDWRGACAVERAYACLASSASERASSRLRASVQETLRDLADWFKRRALLRQGALAAFYLERVKKADTYSGQEDALALRHAMWARFHPGRVREYVPWPAIAAFIGTYVFCLFQADFRDLALAWTPGGEEYGRGVQRIIVSLVLSLIALVAMTRAYLYSSVPLLERRADAASLRLPRSRPLGGMGVGFVGGRSGVRVSLADRKPVWRRLLCLCVAMLSFAWFTGLAITASMYMFWPEAWLNVSLILTPVSLVVAMILTWIWQDVPLTTFGRRKVSDVDSRARA
jgi:hypothetical protein